MKAVRLRDVDEGEAMKGHLLAGSPEHVERALLLWLFRGDPSLVAALLLQGTRPSQPTEGRAPASPIYCSPGPPTHRIRPDRALERCVGKLQSRPIPQ